MDQKRYAFRSDITTVIIINYSICSKPRNGFRKLQSIPVFIELYNSHIRKERIHIGGMAEMDMFYRTFMS